MRRINYKSDIPPLLLSLKVDEKQITVPDCDFIVRFYIEGYEGRHYDCSHIGGVWSNCETSEDGTKLVCYINNQRLGIGELCAEFHYISPDRRYSDGSQKSVVVIGSTEIGVELVEDNGDAVTEAAIDVTLPFIYRTAYEIARDHGYTGTEEDFYSALASVVGIADAEKKRVTAEITRNANEQERIENEENRLNAENERVNAEAQRVRNEAIRGEGENMRIEQEEDRKAKFEEITGFIATVRANEGNRESNELERQTNEDARITEEAKRVEAEKKRAAEFEQQKLDLTGKIDRSGDEMGGDLIFTDNTGVSFRTSDGGAHTMFNDTDDVAKFTANNGDTFEFKQNETPNKNSSALVVSKNIYNALDMTLESMGSALDGDAAYRAEAGDKIFNPDTCKIQKYNSTIGGFEDFCDPIDGKLYANKMTGYIYRWEPKTKKMVFVGGVKAYTKAESDSRYYEKSATDTLLAGKVSKTDIVQNTGQSTTSVMSQKAVSDALSTKVDKTDITQSTGTSETAVMSQKAVSDKLIEMDGKVDGVVESEKSFEDAIRDQVNNYKPIVIEGNVTNAADEEDLTSENGLLKIKNRSSLYGMGYVILRKGKTFAEQVIKANTIYEIRYDFDLNGAEITIPESCVLKFNGGSLSNGILANIGKCINTNNGFKANIKSFSKTLSFIKTSWFSVNENSQPEHNLNILQTALDEGLSIIIDTTKDKFEDGIGIMLNSPLKIKDGNITIKGNSEFGGGLIFKNSDGFVFVNKRYYKYLKFDNLNITSKGYCFNFCNEENGVINEVRPYNIYFSTFSNLKVKSLEKDCFYQGDVAGAGGDDTPIFSVLFDNIYLWTTRFGFNGIHGQTDFVVQNLKDIYVPNSFFKNTAPSIVRNVNSTFGDKNSRASHFMVFDDKIINYGILINCDNCSWEGYRGEIFYEQIETNQELVKRGYNINLTNCAFGYYKSDFNNGKLNIYPITLNRVVSIKFSNIKNPTVEYDTGYSLCRFVSKCDKIQSDVDFSCYYGLKSTGGPIGFIEYYSIWANPTTNLGSYPNSYYEYKTLAQNIDVSKSKVRGMIYTTIDVTDNKTPIIKTDYTVFTTSKNTSIDYIIYNQLYGIGTQESKCKETGRILYFYNKSDYSITFNDGYQTSVISQDVRKFILHPNEFAIVCFNNSKVNNQYSVIKRINYFDNFGSTARRPSLTINEEGFEYYDSTLKKKILWNGTEWTNLDGTNLI